MPRFTGRSRSVARLAAAVALLVAAASCSSDKQPSGSSDVPVTYGISGTVSGAISANVAVTLSTDAGSRTVRTNARGFYVFGGLYDGTYTVEASAEGYAFTPPTITVTIHGADVTDRNFTSQPGIAIAGTISGDAKEGVTLTLMGPDASTFTRTTTTDADGNYRFWNVAAGSYRVTPSLTPGWTFFPANTVVTMAAASVNGANFTAIAPTHALSGRVTGVFATGVVVALSGDAEAVVVTDGTGSFTFAELPPGSYVVTPSYPGYAFTPPERSETIGAADVTDANFVSTATHAISGRVSGDVLAGVSLSLSGAGSGTTNTDASGYFEFTDLVDGIYSVTPALDAYRFGPAARRVTLSGANATGVDFTAAAAPAPSYAVSGSIAGAIPPGVTVTLQGPTTRVTATDAAGAFSLDGVAPGTYLLFPSSDDYLFDPVSYYVVVTSADVADRTFTASLSPAARTISGNVTGAATAGVTLTLVGPSPSTASRTTTTDAAGDFAFRQLVDGRYLLTPSLAGFVFGPADCLVTVAGPSVTYVVFDAARAPHEISGAISPATGGVTVNLSGDATAVATTAMDGTYAFTHLASGSYQVKPELAGFYFSPIEASVVLDAANVTSVDFAIAPSHRIAGHVSGDVLVGVKVTLSGVAAGEATTDAGGYYEFTELRDGGYLLTPSLAGYSFDPLFLPTVLAGADVTTADFKVTLDPTYAVSGTISGAVVSGVGVELRGLSLERTTRTDAGGVYVFTGLSNGSYMVIPSAAGYVFTPASSRAFRIDGADVTGQDFTSVVAP